MYHVRLRFCQKTSDHGGKVLPPNFLTQETCSGKWIHLVHSPGLPPKRKFLNKKCLTLIPKNNFSNEKNFHARLKESITCPTQKMEFLAKIFLKLTQNKPQLFIIKNVLHLSEITDFLPK